MPPQPSTILLAYASHGTMDYRTQVGTVCGAGDEAAETRWLPRRRRKREIFLTPDMSCPCYMCYLYPIITQDRLKYTAWCLHSQGKKHLKYKDKEFIFKEKLTLLKWGIKKQSSISSIWEVKIIEQKKKCSVKYNILR